MMFLSLVSLAAFAVGSSASAVKPRGIANNNCGRAVLGTAKGSAFVSTARADCSSNVISYTTSIITPSASTLTQTVTVQATEVATTIATDVESTTETSIILFTETDQDISTAYSTSTEVLTLTVPVTVTPAVVTAISAVTVTTTSPASTITSYYPTAPAVGAVVPKRDLEDLEDLDGRAVATTKTIPAYASACTDFAQYVAACSAAGVTQTTSTIKNTLPASTITVIASSTITSTIIQTSSTELDLSFTTFSTLIVSTTQSTTVTLPVITTSIETAYTTATSSASTTYLYQTATLTVPASIETVTAPVPNFKLAMVPVAGGTTLYMQVAVGDAIAYKSTTDLASASVFTVDTLNRLVTTAADPEIACAYNPIANYYMEGLRYAALAPRLNMFTPLSCAVNSNLTLTCNYKSANAFTYVPSQSSFFYSSPGYNGYTSYIANLIVQ